MRKRTLFAGLGTLVAAGAIFAATLTSPLFAAPPESGFPHVSFSTAVAPPAWSGPAVGEIALERSNEVVVEFARGTQKMKMAAVSSGGNTELKSAHPAKSSKSLPFAVYSSSVLTAEGLAKQFRGQPGVVAVSPNSTYSIATVPNDPLFPYQWGLQNLGGTSGTADADIDAPDAWDITTGSPDVVVAVIDTGLAMGHWDLEAILWRNTGETSDGVDNDGNGYVDDINGIETVGDQLGLWDRNGHGSHVAGILAADTNNANGMAGVAWQTKIMVLRALDGTGSGTTASVVEAINYAIDMKVNHGVNVVAINASWGDTAYNQVLKDAIDNAGEVGIVFCAAAGNASANNDTAPYYPASFDCSNIIAVGASTSTDTRASFSNFGAASVDVFAPGVDILSAYPRWGQYYPSKGDPFFDDMESGTGNWTVTGASHGVTTAGKWALTTDVYMSPTHAWVDNPGTSSPTSYDNRLTTKPLDMSALKFGGYLGYALFMQLGPNDKLYVRASGEGIMYQLDAKTGYYNGWAYAQIPAKLLTKQFRLRFEVVTDAYDPNNWVFIDDVGITSMKLNDFAYSDGTSMATPFVAGTVALLAAVAPSDSVATRIDRILSHVDQKTAFSGYCSSGGRLNAGAAIQSAVEPPTITSISPNSGPVTGGTSVEIAGANFLGVPATGAVLFGQSQATSYTRVSDTKITAIAPAHLVGVVNVQVTAAGGITADTAADDYEYVPLPTRYEQTDTRIIYNPAWTTFSTGSASGGSYYYSSTTGSSATIYFQGTRLDWIAMMGTTTGLADVYLDDVLAEDDLDLSADVATYQVKVWSTGDLPHGLHKVVIAYESTNPVGKRITLDALEIAGELLAGPPTVTVLNPTSGTAGGGTSVTITGTNLTGATEVRFGEKAATNINVVSSTQITCTTPAYAPGLVDVTVTTPTGTSPTSGTGNDYTFTTPAPTVTTLDPTSGPTEGGTAVTITGTYLTGATAVSFGGTAATDVTVISATQITCTAPPHAAGTVDVTVTTPGGGTSVTTGAGNDYTYVAPVPAVTALSPTSGTTSGGTSVTLTGTGFIGATAVTFGGTAATNIVVVSATEITATAPAHVSGTVDVTVTTAGGTSPIDGAGNDYTYVAPVPVVTAVSPASGTVAGGTGVTLTGTGFIGATAVTFGGEAATSITVVSPTQITCTTPAHAEGTVDVQVTTAGGDSATSGTGDDFTYSVAPTRYEQDDSHIAETGDWYDFTKLGLASGDSYGRSNTPGASATIYFEGTRIDWIAMTGSSPGIVQVYLDGDLKDTIDLYSSPAAYDRNVWSSGTIPAGSHKLELKRSAASLSTEYITMDAVDIWGTITDPPPPPAAITAVSPPSGPLAGGTSVTITGTSLTGATSVTFGGTPATGVSVNGAGTSLTCVSPAHAAGSVDVVVSAPAGVATATSAFTYVEPGAGPTRHEQGDEHIIRTGAWSDFDKTGASAGSYGRSKTLGASATVWFTGTRIDWIAMTGSTPGKVDVYLDDVYQTTVNLYSSPAAYDITVWSSLVLSEGLHSLKIVNMSTKYVTLDAVDIWGTIADPPTRYEQNDTHIEKTGAWYEFSKPGLASGNSYGRSNTPGASATIHFQGTRLDWAAMTGSSPGKVEIYLDGVYQTTVDLYSFPAAYNVMVWSTGSLTDGTHTVELKLSATSDPGEYLTLDAVDIWGSIRSGP